MQSSGQVRRILAKEFGLSISLVDDPIRVVHDGRKVGIGPFSTPKGEVNFSISPKEESIRLKTLFQALGPDAAKSQVRFDRATAIAPTTPKEDDFTPAFLLGLLEDISSVSVQFLAAALRKKNVLVRGGVRGRPLIRKYVMDLILGRGFGIYCEVLDDESLREYTVVLVATAVDVVSLLRGWEEMLLAAEHDPKKSLNYSSLSRGLVLETQRNSGCPYSSGCADHLFPTDSATFFISACSIGGGEEISKLQKIGHTYLGSGALDVSDRESYLTTQPKCQG